MAQFTTDSNGGKKGADWLQPIQQRQLVKNKTPLQGQEGNNGAQIFGSRMVDKVMSARKFGAEDREAKPKQQSATKSANSSANASPGQGFGRMMMTKSQNGHGFSSIWYGDSKRSDQFSSPWHYLWKKLWSD
ncbi:hypothetical protein OIU74_018664 [Salix koriyanagi]|uniref:Uncharacterized protein n=1 Tax=Salix koriyanagi TaxID=2511006 RepID=A0A9Q1AIJ4_9ROSI|nr:hypothetical protein OIU74_018664 [Salix koriyanagi]